jgi:hypothetical protein
MSSSKPVFDWETDFDYLDPLWVANPYSVWDALRTECPIAHSDRYMGTPLPTDVAFSPVHPGAQGGSGVAEMPGAQSTAAGSGFRSRMMEFFRARNVLSSRRIDDAMGKSAKQCRLAKPE